MFHKSLAYARARYDGSVLRNKNVHNFWSGCLDIFYILKGVVLSAVDKMFYNFWTWTANSFL
jgi:hypothetical protein